MLPAQDHKRLATGDTGPMTGGMGAYCPCPLISKKDLDFAVKEILEKTAAAFRASSIKYCGILYAGLMLTQGGPKVLEFNCRFGDPETQVILPLLETDLFKVIWACCNNKLCEIALNWKENLSSVGVVMASARYPESSTKGSEIAGNIVSTGIYITGGGDRKNNMFIILFIFVTYRIGEYTIRSSCFS